MIRSFALAGVAALALTSGVRAQNHAAAQVGLVEENGAVSLSQPRTALVIELAVARERTVAGPYARFAQKFLGVMAPLTDKTVYRIAAASIAACEQGSPQCAAQPAREGMRMVSHMHGGDDFPKLLPDKSSASVEGLEESARKAASTIFSLRRSRIELITGFSGEHVFGAGLKAALDEIARLEQQYLELFMGKQSVRTQVHRMVVTPTRDKTQYVVCRFLPERGVLPATDLSGQPIVLELEPSGEVSTEGLTLRTEKDSRPFFTFCIADNVACRLVDGREQIASATLPLYQFGRVVEVVNPNQRK